jgi:phage antirepressor YoqD-like protein
MSLLKYIERVKRMDDLIRRKATGTPEEFAKRLGVGKTMLMEELRELKLLGAEFYYCKTSQSYCYENEFELKIGRLDKNQQQSLKGGQNYFQDFNPVQYYRTSRP